MSKPFQISIRRMLVAMTMFGTAVFLFDLPFTIEAGNRLGVALLVSSGAVGGLGFGVLVLSQAKLLGRFLCRR